MRSLKKSDAQSRITFRILRLTPRWLRFAIYRSRVHLHYELPEDLEIRLADSDDDYRQAFQGLHDHYVEAALTDPHPSGLRVIPHQALPGTSIVVAKRMGRVVGTLSLVEETDFGLPISSLLCMDTIRDRRPFAEISCLAVDRDMRGQLYFPLIKYAYELARLSGVRTLVIGIPPRLLEYYQAILGFRPIPLREGRSSAPHDLVRGAPAVGAYLDLPEAENEYHRRYRGKRPSKNLHHYFGSARFPGLLLPRARGPIRAEPRIDEARRDYILNARPDVFEALGAKDRRIFDQLWTDVAHERVRRNATKEDDDEPTRS